ncbi:leucine-rich repeat and IQ domain-containing protein 1 isoform X2 [Mastacembelus armatus]|nr:leucine-rich repeat and IQ domain-containing protein 1 isoform X2 [Mastacembelus armatus]
MTDSTGAALHETIMQELNNLIFSDENKDEQEDFLCQEEAASDEIPPSLLSYFEASNNRAAACKKLFLEGLEDLTSSYTEDGMNLLIELEKDVTKLNETVVGETEDKEKNTSADCLVAAPTETEALFTNNVVVSSSNKAETAELTDSSQKEEEMKESGECQREHRVKRLCEEMKKEEQRRQREKNFQEELKKIMEAEKLHQMELELMEKKAQEKLKQELLLQQELIRNLQKRVEEERRMKEEEQKRMKEEEEKKRKREEEKISEMERMDAEMRKIKERVEKDAKKNREEKNKVEEEMIKREARKIKEIRDTEGEERRTKENEDKIKEREMNEERRERAEVTREKMDGNKQKIMLKEDCKEKEVEEEGREGEVRITKELKKQEEMRKKEEKRTKAEKKNDVERRHSVEDKDMMRKEESKTNEEEEAYRQMEEKVNLGMDEKKVCEVENGKVEYEQKTNDKERKQEEEKKKLDKDNIRKEEDGAINMETDKRQIKEVGESKEERRLIEEKECKKLIEQDTKKEENLRTTNELQEKKRGNTTGQSLTSHLVDSITWTSSSPDLLPAETTANPISSENVQQQTSVYKTMDQQDAAFKPCTTSDGLPVCFPEHTEQKRLSWMKNCTSWSKLSLQNRRKQKICVQSRRMLRKAAEVSTLPPLCPDMLLLSTGCKSLQELTTVTLEDLPGCTLSSLVQCTQLQSLTLRRCGLKSLEGLNQLSELCYVDVQENDISFVDCEDMTSLRVLRLGHNKLTSIHGLSGADSLYVLELSHNSITRIAGLESMRRLQRLSVDHNQLICTKGLRDVYTLLYLNCSHNHLVNVEGIENSPLLNTLDLRANSLTEPPSLNNHVLLRELHLDDNCISSLQGLTASWLPLMQHLSAAQNRITKLPCMSDFVSLANLDLQFNCISELQNLCESLKGCKFLQDVYLTGNPLQQESGWRSTLETALPGLRAIDNQVMDSFLSAPPVQQVSLSSVTFLIFCQTQLQQTCELQQQLSRELSNASSSLDAVKDLCRHFTEILKLAEDQRFAHEYGNITVFTSQVMQKKSVAMDNINAEMFIKHSEMEATDKGLTVNYSNNNRCSYWTFEESSTENWCDPLGAVTKTDHHSLATKEITSSSDFEMVAVSNYQDLDLKNTAAVVIQQWWRKYRQKCGIIRSPLSSERERGRRGDGEKPELDPSYLNGSFVGQHQAATVIQAFWRGFTLRRRLASALTAVTCLSTKEDDTFEDVDMDEFVFDGTALEQWTLQLPGDSSSRCDCVSEVPLSPKPPGLFRGPPQDTLPPPVVWRPKQAWGAGEHLGSAWQSDSSEASNRSKSPALASQLSGLSERSEKILEEWGFTDSHTALLMLKRAQKMKSKKEQQKKHKDPLVRLALFRNCNYQLNPVETRNRPAPRNRKDLKVCKAKLGDKTEQVKQERTQQWLRTESDRDSESEHFLPEISSDILNGGRVQLVADPGRHHSSGLWANSSLAVQPCRQNSYLRRNSLGHARKEVLSPKRVASAPSKKERISFRDNPVQLSGGWGGGRKRDKVHK